MNFLARFYPGDEVVRLAVSAALQIAGVVVLATTASWVVSRRNAALRDGILRAALALVCAAPVLAWGFNRAGIDLWRMAERQTELHPRVREVLETPTKTASPLVDRTHRDSAVPNSAISTAASAPVPQVTPTVSLSSETEKLDKRTRLEAVIGTFTAIWAIGANALLVRLIAGLCVVARLRRDLKPLVDLPADVGERLTRTLGVAQLPPIMLSERFGGPASVGLWRPVVVLPAEMASNMCAEALHDTLAHECAHALRRDALVALVQQIVAAVYWVHPFVYALNRQLARAREEICDNVVLAGTTATDYARTLLALSQAVQTSRGRLAVIPMFDRRWRLARRVAGILNTRRITMTRMNNPAAALIAAVAVTSGIALAAICAAADPPKESQTKAATDAGDSKSSVPIASNDGETKERSKPTQSNFSGPVRSASKMPAAAGEPPEVLVSRVIERDVTDFEVFTGNIVAAASVKIIPRVTGYLTAVSFKEGADVKKGDKLFEIDPRPFQADVDKAEAELRVAETRLKLAEAQFARLTQMRKSSAVSQEEYDKSQATVQEAQAVMTAAKANVEGRRLSLSFCTIASPIDGRAGGFNVTPGNLVKQDETVLITIVSHDSIGVSFDIDERNWLRMAKMPREPNTKVFVRADDETGFEHEGVVNFIANEFNRTTGTIIARATIANPALKSGAKLFIPGMHVAVRLMIGQPHLVVLVSDKVLQSVAVSGNPFSGRRTVVSVVDDEGVIKSRAVKTGELQQDGLRVVESGLKPGERVIVDPAPWAEMVGKIRPKLVPMPTTHSNESKAEN